MRVLGQLDADGRWQESTARLEAVRVVLTEETPVGPESMAAAVYLALQEPEGAYVLGWAAIKVGDKWLFTGATATGATKRRASEWDDVGILGLMTDDGASAPALEIQAAPDAPAAPPPPAC